MKEALRKMMIVGAIGLASFLPIKNLEAKTASGEDTTKTEETQKNKLSVNLNANLANKTRFWGSPFINSPVYTQSLNADYGNFSASIVGETEVNKKKLFNLIVRAGFVQPLSKKISLNLGYLFSNFNLEKGWEKVSMASAGLATSLPLNPSITYNRLLGLGGGAYVEGDLSQEIPITKNISVNLSGKLGYNDKAMRDRSSFTHLEGNVNVPIKLSDEITLSPYLSYFQPLASDFTKGLNAGLNIDIKL